MSLTDGQAHAGLLGDVATYYSAKLAQHGATPAGVDWNGPSAQTRRFEQLLKIIGADAPFSLNDLGCGYGALLDCLGEQPLLSSYLGVDVAEAMIQAASQRHQADPRARFIVSGQPDRVADYGIASGIFNVRQGHPADAWRVYVEDALDILDRTSARGFAFNCLTSWSDPGFQRDDLHYADPAQMLSLCLRKYSRQVALLHDYGMYEFTILVRKA